MKTSYIILLLALYLLSNTANAQTITSVANGNWTSPATWGGYPPTPGSSVVINHTVTLDLDYGYSSGSITINASGSLSGNSTMRGLTVSGGTLTVNGTLNIARVTLFSGIATNSGTFQNDSLLVSTTFTNNSGATINATEFMINTGGTFNNNGTVTSTDLLNINTATNNGTITSFNFMNSKNFTNASAGFMTANYFLNSDSLASPAVFTNNGQVTVNNNWANDGTSAQISGTGKFCIQDSTFNSGTMTGTFDFCDQTGVAIDLNTGTISNGITYCQYSCSSDSVPAVPGPITGNTTVCQGSYNTYSVAPVSGATSYTWTLPGGWSGTSVTNSITAVAGSGGNISVTADNQYGSSAPQIQSVSVLSVNTAVSQLDSTFTASAAGAIYQWINCSGNTPIAGANSQSYTAATDGNYAVIITQNGCTDTSSCYYSGLSGCQVSITGADLPYSGLSVLLGNDTTTVVSLGLPDTGQVWDYSMLLNHYPKFAVYDLTSSTPYASAFPSSNLYTYGPAILFGSLFGGTPNPNDMGYAFWETGNTGHWMSGFRNESGPTANMNIAYNPHELLIGAPANYGSVFNNSSKWELSLNSNPADVDTYYVHSVTKVITADACGSITTPFATFPSVLREHEYLIVVDSVIAKMGGFTVSQTEFSRDTLNNYIYLANGIGYPVCIVHTDKYFTVKDVEYYSGIFTGTNNKPVAETQLLLYPNPSEGNITIEIPQEPANIDNQIFIYNSSGILVWKKSTPDAVINIDLSILPKGLYFIKTHIGKKSYTKKMVIQ